MELRELVQREDVPSVQIDGLCIDSRQIQPGDLFIAVRGETYDGHDYVQQAIDQGAVGVLAESQVDTPENVTLVVDPESVKQRNQLAARFYQQPSSSLTCIGTTGTNGKTSITYGLASSLPQTGFLGSLGTGILPNLTETGLTTIDGVRLQRELALFKDLGLRYAAIEVSSHALAQNRVSQVEFNIGVFTNLTRDHLDYHESMEAYGSAKRRLFTEFELDCAVINGDDPFGQELIQLTRQNGVRTLTYGQHPRADVSWSDVSYSRNGVKGTWCSRVGQAALRLPGASEFALSNAAAVIGVLIHLDYDIEAAASAVARASLPPGRLEFFQAEGTPQVVVDFAHTPDALERVLKSLRRLKPHQVTCVFGCGGDRDVGKREKMGEVVSRLADKSIVTNDNPRSEDPCGIAQAIVQGMNSGHATEVILDRDTAIRTAIETSTKEDLVLVAGKGSETYQDIQGQRLPFNDREVVQNLMEGG